MQWISICSQLAGDMLPPKVSAHSTRTPPVSPACFRNMPVSDICKAAIWSNPLTLLNIMHLTWQRGQIPSSGKQYLNLHFTDTMETLLFYWPGRILLVSHLQCDPTNTYLKKEQLFILWQVWFLEMVSLVGSHNLPSVPTSQSPQQHTLSCARELREGHSCPTLYALIWEHEEVQGTCAVATDTVSTKKNPVSGTVEATMTITSQRTTLTGE